MLNRSLNISENLPLQRRLPLLPSLAAALLLAGTLSACAHPKSTGDTSSKTMAHHVAAATPAERPPCVMKIPGTTLSAHDVEGGIVAEFKNAGAAKKVQERMVAHLAYDKAHPHAMAIKITKTLETTTEGVRITFRAVDPSQVAQLREMLKKKFAKMAAHHATPATEAAPATDAPKAAGDTATK